MIVSKTKDIVREKLLMYPSCRDNDNELMARIWYMEAQDKNISMKYFFGMMKDGLFTPSESIRRCRQKLQELNPELRGLKYKSRQKGATETKKDLINNF